MPLQWMRRQLGPVRVDPDDRAAADSSGLVWGRHRAGGALALPRRHAAADRAGASPHLRGHRLRTRSTWSSTCSVLLLPGLGPWCPADPLSYKQLVGESTPRCSKSPLRNCTTKFAGLAGVRRRGGADGGGMVHPDVSPRPGITSQWARERGHWRPRQSSCPAVPARWPRNGEAGGARCPRGAGTF